MSRDLALRYSYALRRQELSLDRDVALRSYLDNNFYVVLAKDRFIRCTISSHYNLYTLHTNYFYSYLTLFYYNILLVNASSEFFLRF